MFLSFEELVRTSSSHCSALETFISALILHIAYVTFSIVVAMVIVDGL